MPYTPKAENLPVFREILTNNPIYNSLYENLEGISKEKKEEYASQNNIRR
jgi:hypothetical protein